MLSKEIRKELEERLGAKIKNIYPFTVENSDGKSEQIYAVTFRDPKYQYTLDVDEFGAALGGDGCKYEVTVF